MKYTKRFFGGSGVVFLNYGILRVLENKPAILFLIAFSLLAYGVGFLLDNETYKED